MKLGFYSVDNSKDYDRHTFDCIYDEPKKIEEMLNELEEDEFRIYDMSEKSNAYFFQDEFNDEVLDNGWWCVPIFE